MVGPGRLRTDIILHRCFGSCCVLGCGSSDLCDLCRPMSDDAARRVLCSATSCELLVPWSKAEAPGLENNL